MPARGIAYALLGVFLFSAHDVLVKWLVADYPVLEIIFFRSLAALIPCALFVRREGGVRALRTRRRSLLLLRGLLGVSAFGPFYLAYAFLPLADVIAIGFSAPLFVTALSAPLLGEKVGWRRWAAVVVGFLGVLVMVRPGSTMFEAAALLALAGSALYALAMIVTRRLVATETTAAVIVFANLVYIAVGGLSLPFRWVAPSAGDALLLAALGLITGCAQFWMTQAYRYARAATVAPFDYTALIWAVLFGYLIWGDVPGVGVALGASLVIATGLYILRREAPPAAGFSAARPRGWR